MNKPNFIVVHHSGSKDDNYSSSLEAIRDFHVNHRGWNDIGYHLLIERVDGKPVLETGRNIYDDGAHCPGMNRKSIGLCFVGNFEIDYMDDDILEFGAHTLADLCIEYSIFPVRILPHNKAALPGHATACPGKNFPFIKMIKRVEELLREGSR